MFFISEPRYFALTLAAFVYIGTEFENSTGFRGQSVYYPPWPTILRGGGEPGQALCTGGGVWGGGREGEEGVGEMRIEE